MILLVAAALRRSQFGFFAQYQAIAEKRHAQLQYEETDAAGHGTQADRHHKIREIERVAHMAVGAIGHQRPGLDIGGIDHIGLKVGGSPGAEEGGCHKHNRGQSEEDARQRIRVDTQPGRQQIGHCGGYVLRIRKIKQKGQRNDEAKHQGPVLELPICGFHIHEQIAGSHWRRKGITANAECKFRNEHKSLNRKDRKERKVASRLDQKCDILFNDI